MKISSKTWQKYIKKLAKINTSAAADVVEYMINHDVSTYEGTKALIDYAYAVSTKYGEAAAELSCQMYEEVAMASGVFIPAAEPAATATYGETAKAIRGKMFDTKDPDAIGASVGRLVKMAGVDTTMKNALRDGAEWAWIPSGDTCAFCLMLASNGWQKASKNAIRNGHAEHIHNNCDCTYAVRFDNDLNVEGYDPDALYDEYIEAGETRQERLNAIRRKLYAKDPEKYRAQSRAAYALRQYRKLPDDEGFFSTFDGRGTGKQYDVIKPRNLYKDLDKTETGKEAVKLIEDNGYSVKLFYGADNTDADGNRIKGKIDHREKTIIVFADTTGSVTETASTVVHEANHLDDFGYCRKSEAYCEIKAKMHSSRRDKLTLSEIKSIIKKTDKSYDDLTWLE